MYDKIYYKKKKVMPLLICIFMEPFIKKETTDSRGK